MLVILPFIGRKTPNDFEEWIFEECSSVEGFAAFSSAYCFGSGFICELGLGDESTLSLANLLCGMAFFANQILPLAYVDGWAV
jgi:hypothetical protein